MSLLIHQRYIFLLRLEPFTCYGGWQMPVELFIAIKAELSKT